MGRTTAYGPRPTGLVQGLRPHYGTLCSSNTATAACCGHTGLAFTVWAAVAQVTANGTAVAAIMLATAAGVDTATTAYVYYCIWLPWPHTTARGVGIITARSS